MSKQPLPGVIEGQTLTSDEVFDADVCIIGSGAGGAVSAAVLQQAGLKVVVLEEGGYFTSNRFRMLESEGGRDLYQDHGLRPTKDASAALLQGKAVGGTTVINWTTSYRTPDRVLNRWKAVHAVGHVTAADLAPHFDAIEQRLHIAEWPLAQANRNNRLLFDGCKALGWEAHSLHRNVHGCADTGFCGQGCPIDAKQSMLVSYLPDAMNAGATVVSRCRVERLRFAGGQVVGIDAVLLDASGRYPTGVKLDVKAKTYLLAGGALGTPGILLRSGAPDPHQRAGVRTFIHPVTVGAAQYDEPVRASRGAPQSVASKHFYDRGEEVGFLLEAVPVHPGLLAPAAPGFGMDHREIMEKMEHTAIHLALTGDGLHDDVPGGQVGLRKDGSPLLDYAIAPKIWSAFREAQKIIAKLQFATGAKRVFTFHDPLFEMKTVADVDGIDRLPYKPYSMPVFSAHVMGGAGMSDDPKLGVVRSEDLRHHQVANLHVVDGSVFPTGLGVNPQETIYGVARLAATRIAAQLR